MARLKPFPKHLPPIPPAIIPSILDASGASPGSRGHHHASKASSRPAAVLILIFPRRRSGGAPDPDSALASGAPSPRGPDQSARRGDRPRRRVARGGCVARGARGGGPGRGAGRRPRQSESYPFSTFAYLVSSSILSWPLRERSWSSQPDDYEVGSKYSARRLTSFLPGAPIETGRRRARRLPPALRRLSDSAVITSGGDRDDARSLRCLRCRCRRLRLLSGSAPRPRRMIGRGGPRRVPAPNLDNRKAGPLEHRLSPVICVRQPGRGRARLATG